MVPLLETERLTLREISEEDFGAVHAYASDPEVVQYVPWGPNTSQDTHDFLATTMTRAVAELRLEYVLGVELRSSPGMLGTVGLYLRSRDHDQAMLGYAYGSGAWGQGIATEAALAMVAMGFDVLGLRRIWASCDPDNHGSRRVLEKVGMQVEGLLRGDMVIRGDVRDNLLWGILEPEWRDRTINGTPDRRPPTRSHG
jgi:RimJ/RimL family protein N-acetyltransferase